MQTPIFTPSENFNTNALTTEGIYEFPNARVEVDNCGMIIEFRVPLNNMITAAITRNESCFNFGKYGHYIIQEGESFVGINHDYRIAKKHDLFKRILSMEIDENNFIGSCIQIFEYAVINSGEFLKLFKHYSNYEYDQQPILYGRYYIEDYDDIIVRDATTNMIEIRIAGSFDGFDIHFKGGFFSVEKNYAGEKKYIHIHLQLLLSDSSNMIKCIYGILPNRICTHNVAKKLQASIVNRK